MNPQALPKRARPILQLYERAQPLLQEDVWGVCADKTTIQLHVIFLHRTSTLEKLELKLGACEGIVSFGQVAVEASSLGVAVPWPRPGEELRRAGLAYKAMALTVGIIAARGHN